MTQEHTPPTGRVGDGLRAVRGGLATDPPAGGDNRGGLSAPTPGVPDNETASVRDREQELLRVMAWRPPVHPSVALAMVADLSRSLVDVVLVGYDKAPEVHRQLVRLAQTCIESAEELERVLSEQGRFKWHNAQVEWDSLLDALDAAERRADMAVAKARAYRAGRLDERLAP